MKHQITNQRYLCRAFWQAHPQADRRKAPLSKHNYGQNRYCTDTRVAWVDYVDRMARDGTISESLAQRATLE